MARSIRKLNRRGEEGYMLIAVLFLVVMVLITLSIAAPKMAKEIERDREIELVHRGKQFQRAIQLYYRKFGAYPPNMEALEKTNNIRFLRRRYKDPMTGKDEWHLIHFGENKTPTALGFFGQPISGVGGATLAGTGPGGVGQNIGSPIGGGGAFGSNGGGAFGNNNGGGGFGSNSGSSFGNSGSSLFSNNSSNGTNGVAGLGTNSPNGSDPTAAQNGGQNGQPTDPNAANGSTNGSSSSSSIFGNSSGTNQTFGGGGIIGVESTSPKLAILEWKKQKHFNQWEFVYDPIADQRTISGGNSVGQGIGGAGNSGFGPGGQGGGLNGGQSGGGIFGGGGINGGQGGQQPTPTPTPTPDPNSPSVPQPPAPQ